MRHWGLLALTASIMVAGCGGDDNSPTTPSQPNTVTFSATLLPSNEVPAISNAEQSGRGTATITFNLTRNTAGAIQSGTVDFHYDLTAFPAGTTIVASHIHPGAAGTNGAVLISTGQSAATSLGLPNGAGSWEARAVTGQNVDATNLQAIIDNPAGYYFNVHSTQNGGGVARGQLVKQ
jgi:hypothetical protein